MSQEKSTALAQKLFGPEVTVATQELGQNAVQAGVIHPTGIPLIMVLASDEAIAFEGMEAAMETVLRLETEKRTRGR